MLWITLMLFTDHNLKPQAAVIAEIINDKVNIRKFENISNLGHTSRTPLL